MDDDDEEYEDEYDEEAYDEEEAGADSYEEAPEE